MSKATCTSEQVGSIPSGSTLCVLTDREGISMKKFGFALPPVSMFLLSLIPLLLGLCFGCTNHDPSGSVVSTNDQTHYGEGTDFLHPPNFDLGDTVSVEDAIKVGIVIDCVSSPVEGDYIWVYSVMFQNKTIKYTEDKLVLIESFDWGQSAKQGIID